MKNKDAFEQDVNHFLANREGLKLDDQKTLLMGLFDKHIVLNQADLIMSAHDFSVIMGLAKGEYANISLPLTVRGKEIPASDIGSYSIVLGVISFLNQKNALQRLPTFDRR